MKNIKKYILIVVCGILAVSSVFMTIETTSSGVEVSSLRNKEAELVSQKRDLEDSLVKNTSVSSLQEESSTMGYVKPSVLVYVAPSQPVAKLP
jgi:cell division protein FtsL